MLQRVAKAGGLFIDVVAYPFFTDIDKVLEANPASSWGSYRNGLKLGGCKITSDGSNQGKTGWFTTPYLTGGPAGEKNWKGEPGLPVDAMRATVKKCYDNNLQVNFHANGDAAIDFLLEAHKAAAGADLAKDRRTVCIHCQFIRPDQIAEFARLKLIPSLFTDHAFFFADTHILNRGRQATDFLSPMKSALAAGLRPTNHTDAFVAPIDQMMTVWTAVNRISRKGELIGAGERITPYQALQAITTSAAYQYREEASKGSIEVGKRADLVVLSADPNKVAPMTIKDIKVVETIKDGKTIWPAS
jgi:predicted amidohydrolase YtcJ